MSVSVSRVHYCIGQEMVALGKEGNEPPAPECKCRKFIGLTEATAMVKRNEARWTVLAREYELSAESCPMCLGDKEIKNCAQCGGTGEITVYRPVETYGNDIVYSSEKPKDKKDRKYKPTLAMKTPRVATIESEHIIRAYIDEVKEAAERIEEYGRLILDARTYVGKDRIPCIGVEPRDNPVTGEGRNCDSGRAPFCQYQTPSSHQADSTHAGNRISAGMAIMKKSENEGRAN